MTHMHETQRVRSAARSIVRDLGFLKPDVQACGVSHSQCHSLIELRNHPTLTSGDLAQRLRLDKSTMSRTLQQLVEMGMVKETTNSGDRRVKDLQLTAVGHKKVEEINRYADTQVEAALDLLSAQEIETVSQGLVLYAAALQRSGRLQQFAVELITEAHNAGVRQLIHTVMPEFDCVGPGFTLSDPEVEAMWQAYTRPRHRYFVAIDKGGKVVGGGGYGPLAGVETPVCELRKMYLLPGARGCGLGADILRRCLESAKDDGFEQCYLETRSSMYHARKLYMKFGFREIDQRMGDTGHFACDAMYVKHL